MGSRIMMASLLLMLGLAQAISFEVTAGSFSYSEGDRLLIEAKILNDADEAFDGMVYSTLSSDGSTPEAVIPMSVHADPDTEALVVLYDINITDNHAPGEYVVTAYLVSDQLPVAYGEYSFMVEGTLKRLDARLVPCLDEGCEDTAKLILVGTEVYLDALCSAQDASCSGTMALPSGSTRPILLPGWVALEEEGTHRIDAICSAKGHHPTEASLMLGVLGSMPEVRTISYCDEDGVCQGPESHANCPQDCLPEGAAPPESVPSPDYLHIGIAILMIILMISIWKLSANKPHPRSP